MTFEDVERSLPFYDQLAVNLAATGRRERDPARRRIRRTGILLDTLQETQFLEVLRVRRHDGFLLLKILRARGALNRYAAGSIAVESADVKCSET